MLRAGDEFAQTQSGNNNAYCQDNETSWLVWPGAAGVDLTPFIGALSALRRRRPELRRDTFFKGSPREGRQPDVRWLHPAGQDMTPADWADEGLRTVGMLLGAADESAGDLLLLASASHDPVGFVLEPALAGRWRVCLDTAGRSQEDIIIRNELRLDGRSLTVLERTE
jgi:glycogen operon protein